MARARVVYCKQDIAYIGNVGAYPVDITASERGLAALVEATRTARVASAFENHCWLFTARIFLSRCVCRRTPRCTDLCSTIPLTGAMIVVSYKLNWAAAGSR